MWSENLWMRDLIDSELHIYEQDTTPDISKHHLGSLLCMIRFVVNSMPSMLSLMTRLPRSVSFFVRARDPTLRRSWAKHLVLRKAHLAWYRLRSKIKFLKDKVPQMLCSKSFCSTDIVGVSRKIKRWVIACIKDSKSGNKLHRRLETREGKELGSSLGFGLQSFGECFSRTSGNSKSRSSCYFISSCMALDSTACLQIACEPIGSRSS
jgi:hypothetical protein